MTQADETTLDSPPAGGDDSTPKSELQTLLEEFTSANSAKDSKDLEPVIQFAKDEMDRKQKESLDGDIANAVDVIKGADDSLKDVNPKLIQGLMEAYAREDKSFVKAFEQRGDNPKAWQDALVGGSKFAADLLGDIKGGDRDDIEAAKAAVDGTSTEPASSDDGLSGPELRKLSDVDFRQRLAEEVAKAEGAR